MSVGLHFLFIGLAALVQAPAAPPPEALVERFIAVLPDVAMARVVDRTPDPQELERLTALNPGRGADVRQVLEEKRACSSANENEAAIAVLRRAAHSLGSASLERIIAFYESADYPRFNELTKLAQQGETLSPEQVAQLERMDATYGLASFYEASKAQMAAIGDDTAFTRGVMRCRSEAEAALGRLQLKTR